MYYVYCGKAQRQKGRCHMVRALGYVRVSTDMQVRDGVSLEQQESSVRQFAAARGFDLVDVLRDEGMSGMKGDRPGFVSVLDAVSKRQVDAVVCYSLSRFGRSTLRNLGALDLLVKHGVDFFTVSEGGDVDLSTPAGKFTVTIRAGLAEYVRNEIAQKTRDALQFKKAKGERVGSVPFGFRVAGDGVHLVPDEHEQRVLQTVKKLRQAGHSLRGIVQQLDKKGLHNRRTGTGTWHLTSIARIVTASATRLAA